MTISKTNVFVMVATVLISVAAVCPTYAVGPRQNSTGAGGALMARDKNFASEGKGGTTRDPSVRAAITPPSEASDHDAGETTSKGIEEARRREIVGEPVQDRRAKRFLELVILPFGVCFLLVALLRRGLWN